MNTLTSGTLEPYSTTPTLFVTRETTLEPLTIAQEMLLVILLAERRCPGQPVAYGTTGRMKLERTLRTQQQHHQVHHGRIVHGGIRHNEAERTSGRRLWGGTHRSQGNITTQAVSVEVTKNEDLDRSQTQKTTPAEDYASAVSKQNNCLRRTLFPRISQANFVNVSS